MNSSRRSFFQSLVAVAVGVSLDLGFVTETFSRKFKFLRSVIRVETPIFKGWVVDLLQIPAGRKWGVNSGTCYQTRIQGESKKDVELMVTRTIWDRQKELEGDFSPLPVVEDYEPMKVDSTGFSWQNTYSATSKPPTRQNGCI